jgi:hypothetical protein
MSIQIPAAAVLLAGGAVACFAGYRLFRFVLGVYGFILGALLASSMMGTSEPWALVVAAIAGGAVGALVLVAGYFVGVALMGAALGALIVTLGWKLFKGDPQPVVVIVVAAIGAFAAMAFQRYVIIAATSLGGAWTLLVGATALLLGKSAKAGSAGSDIWVAYPGSVGVPGLWAYGVWMLIALAGIFVQLRTSTAKSRKKS